MGPSAASDGEQGLPLPKKPPVSCLLCPRFSNFAEGSRIVFCSVVVVVVLLVLVTDKSRLEQ